MLVIPGVICRTKTDAFTIVLNQGGAFKLTHPTYKPGALKGKKCGDPKRIEPQQNLKPSFQIL